MRISLLALSFLAIVMGVVTIRANAPTSVHAEICNTKVPHGAIAPAVPIWCHGVLPPGIDTHIETANSWMDDFNHGQSHAGLSAAYARGLANGDALDAKWFQHNNHWMVDIQGDNGQWPTLGAAWMRPNRQFRTEAGKLVVEFEVASPIAGTRNIDGVSDTWPEFTISTAPAPTKLRASGTYLYENFVGYWTFGCRMQQSRHPICSLYEPADGYAGGPTRQWEANQNGGEVTDQFGGDPTTPGLANVWKTCDSVDDPDINCRNKFRVELTSTRMIIFVNGTRFYEAGFIDSQLSNILNGPFYVYFGDFAYQISQDTVVRYHWDRLAINPTSGGGTLPVPATATPTRTPVGAATATPTRTPIAATAAPTRTSVAATSTPTRTPVVAAPTRTSTPVANATRTATPLPSTPPVTGGTIINFDSLSGVKATLSGQYPAGLINWGRDHWYLSGPWGPHSTNSISFNGMYKSKTFTFVQPKVLESVVAGGTSPSTITLSCAGNAKVTKSIPAGTLTTITTGWRTPCTAVTIGSSNTWSTNFDNFKVR